MTRDDIASIEKQLGVTLPVPLAEFFASEHRDVDAEGDSILDRASDVIELTREYRAGFAGLPPWPASWVYIGDEGDACPYYVDCETGRIVRLHKGNFKEKPLEVFADFSALHAHLRDIDGEVAQSLRKGKWDFLYGVVPVVGVILVFGSILGLVFLVRWLIDWAR